MTTKATIIIPIYNLEDTSNLECNLEHIIKCKIPCVVSLQVKHESDVSEISDIIDCFDEDGILSLNYEVINDNVIHRAELVRSASKDLDSEYIWMVDPDIYLPYETILNAIGSQEIIKPFHSVHTLSEEQTFDFFGTQSTTISECLTQNNTRLYGSISYIIQKVCWWWVF